MKTRRQATYVQPTDLVTTPRAQSPSGFINVRQNLAVNEYGEYGGPFTSFVDDNFSGLRHFISTCKDSRCKTCPRLFYKYICKYFKTFLPFFEDQKKCPDFGKTCSDCVHP